MLNGSILSFDGTGRIRNSVAAPTSYSGGIGFVGPLLVVKLAFPPDYYHQSNPFLTGSSLSANSLDPTHYSQGGLPHVADGALSADVVAAITHYSHGLPYTAAGRLALAVAE